MQILIELNAKSEGFIYSNDVTQLNDNIIDLYKLMMLLDEDGYRINTLYGKFIFSESRKEIIDIGESGIIIPPSIDFAMSVFDTGGVLAVIDTDKKYLVFANRYFLASHFCHMRKVLPITLYTVRKYYFELIKMNNRKLLRKLYFEQFIFIYGKNSKQVSYFKDDYTLHTKGYAIPGPIIRSKNE